MNESHELQADKIHQEALRKMSPTQKWELARTLYETAWQLKAVGVRAQNPDWSNVQIQEEVRRIFLHGHT